MKYEIKVVGPNVDPDFEGNYTFEEPREGNIAEEVAALLKEMEGGNISSFTIKEAEYE